MSNESSSNLIPSELVDREWYLKAYPDVADAGLSAEYHYEHFGRVEGRYPRLLKAICLEEKLWGGFSKLAHQDLVRLMQDFTTSLNERISAAWVLAKWYASNNDWSGGHSAIEFLVYTIRRDELPSYISLVRVKLLAAEMLSKLGRTQEMISFLDYTLTNENITGDLLLTRANLLADANQSRRHSEDTWLSGLNKIFSRANLTKLKKIKPDAPLSLENLAAHRVPSVRKPEKVSIVVPAYNCEKHIGIALHSLLNQSWLNIEIIVVDDASTDGTCALVEQFITIDSRVFLIRHTQNKGAYASRNTGMYAATGTFLATHDADDWSHPQKIELLTEALIADSRLVGTMSSWVRIDDSFRFKNIGKSERIIHASVSTLILKTSVVRDLGGWDEVRVAADSEMYERLIHLYGLDCIADVLPELPLVVAQDLPNSLTNAADTHSHTQFFGVRKTYREIYRVWHSTLKLSEAQCFTRHKSRRSFPAPTFILSNSIKHNYDIVIFSDFSLSSKYFSALQTIIHRLIDENRAIAIFHWPDYTSVRVEPIADFFIHEALHDSLDILSCADSAICHHLLLFGMSLFSFSLDKLPKIKANSRSVSTNTTSFYQAQPEIFKNISDFDRQIVRSSQLFNADWYLSLYPDIRNSKIDPIEHYIHHGMHEGRGFSPFFSEDFYNLTYRTESIYRHPAILHYLKFGIKLKLCTFPPRISGRLELNKDRKTVILCGHASGIKLYGAERCLLDILDSYRDLGLNMLVTIPEYANPQYIRDLAERSFMVAVVPTPLWTQSPEPYAYSTHMYTELIREFSVEVAHVNTVMLREPLIAARQCKIPTLVHVHEILDDQDEACAAIGLSAREVYETLSSFSSHLVANSEYTRQNLITYNKTSIVSNTVNFEKFDIPNIVDVNKITVAIISSNLEKKGIFDFVELASRLERIRPNISCLMVGPSTDAILALRSSNTTIPNNLTLVDYIDSPLDAIGMANIIVNMSRCRETFGRTILEGMAARRAVLAYAEGAFPELIDDAVTGFLVPYLDVGAMVNIIDSLCADPAEIVSYGERARRNVLTRFNRTEVADQLKTALGLATNSAMILEEFSCL